jgi:hypothetical protein
VLNKVFSVLAQVTPSVKMVSIAIASTALATQLLAETRLAVNSKSTGIPFLALLLTPV